ncbi:hypothetical protein PFISCL1PPCAC_20808, partial [Pristionchus fissidentatus]
DIDCCLARLFGQCQLDGKTGEELIKEAKLHNFDESDVNRMSRLINTMRTLTMTANEKKKAKVAKNKKADNKETKTYEILAVTLLFGDFKLIDTAAYRTPTL